MESATSGEEYSVSFYEFYIRDPKVFGVGYRPFIADILDLLRIKAFVL